MKAIIRILAQVYNENGKPKMGKEFEFEMDSDDAMYCSNMKEICEALLKEESKTWVETFEYRNHEVMFCRPKMIDDSLVENVIQNNAHYN